MSKNSETKFIRFAKYYLSVGVVSLRLAVIMIGHKFNLESLVLFSLIVVGIFVAN